MTIKRVTAALVLALMLSGSSSAFADDDATRAEVEKAAAVLARLLLKGPIDKACADANLNQCEHITEGVLLFLEGKPEIGKLTLRDAAQANAPEQVKAFAQLIGAIGDVPGTDKYLGPILDAARFLTDVGNFKETPSEAPVVDGPRSTCRNLIEKHMVRDGVTEDQCVVQLTTEGL